jgi:hypothetical protein
VSDRGNEKGCGAGREVLFLDHDEVISVDEIGQLRRAGAVAEQVVRASLGYLL